MTVYARLRWSKNAEYEMDKRRIIVGKSTALFPVDVDVGPSSYISRQHLIIIWKMDNLKLRCKGKNGIFINQVFRPCGSDLYIIPPRCTLRFPSTSICIEVQWCNIRLKRSLRHTNIAATVGDSGNESSCSDNEYSGDQLEQDCSERSDFLSTAFPAKFLTQPSRTRRKQSLVPSSCMDHRGIRMDLHTSSVNSMDAQSSPLNDINLTGTTDNIISSTSNSNKWNDLASSDLRNVHVLSPPNLSNVSHQQMKQSFANSIVIGQVKDFIPKSQLTSVFQITHLTTLERGDRFTKPPYSYAQLIAQAIASQPDRQLTLSGIYDYISKNYPYYQPNDKGWQNSVRHNLSLNRQFVKLPRSQEDHGKGCFWRIDPLYEQKLLNMAFRKRRIRGSESPNPKSSYFIPNPFVHNGSVTNSVLIPASTFCNLAKSLNIQGISKELYVSVSNPLMTSSSNTLNCENSNGFNVISNSHSLEKPLSLRSITSPFVRVLTTKPLLRTGQHLFVNKKSTTTSPPGCVHEEIPITPYPVAKT